MLNLLNNSVAGLPDHVIVCLKLHQIKFISLLNCIPIHRPRCIGLLLVPVIVLAVVVAIVLLVLLLGLLQKRTWQTRSALELAQIVRSLFITLGQLQYF